MGRTVFHCIPKMSDSPAHVKYKDSIESYKATLYRSAFAIRKELEPGLKEVVELSGAPSVSGMLSMMARAPQECAELLKPIFERLADEKQPRRRLKVTMKSIVDEMKSGEVSPAELAAALAKIKADREAGQ